MIKIIVEEVAVENLGNNLMEAKMMIKRIRMRLAVVVRTRGEITQIIPMIKTIEIREEEEERKELEEEAFVEKIFTIVKKDIDHLNVLSAKEGIIEEMAGRLELQLLMKIQNHHILKMLKEKS